MSMIKIGIFLLSFHSNDETALFLASEIGSLEIVNAIIERNPNLDIKTLY